MSLASLQVVMVVVVAVGPLVELRVTAAVRQVLKGGTLAVVQQDGERRLLVGGASVGQTVIGHSGTGDIVA